MHLSIAGNIGAGKTTLTFLLSKHYGWKPHYEGVEENPYLDHFYNDMKRWAFNLQIYFLSHRFKQVKAIQESKENVIQDRTIYEDAYIFAANLHDMGLMDSRDYITYKDLFELMGSFLRPPDLLIYLRASTSTLVERIHKRGREYENGISIDYLSHLNECYEAWIKSYDRGKLLIFDVDALDFVDNPEHLGEIIHRVDAELHGLFG